MYAKEHIKIVMNMDFQQPNDKMQKMAADHGVDNERRQAPSESWWAVGAAESWKRVRILKEDGTDWKEQWGCIRFVK